MNKSEKDFKRNLIGLYKRCINACTTASNDTNRHWKKQVNAKIKVLSSNLN